MQQAVDSSNKQRAAANGRQLRNAINVLNVYWNGPTYIPLDDYLGSVKFVNATKRALESGEKKTDEELEYLYRWIIVNKGLRHRRSGKDIKEFIRWKEWFDEKMWPLLREKACEAAGLYDFYMETGARSDAVIMFDYDAWTGDLATACLLGHGITHDIDGNLIPIDEDDPMSTYIKENASLAFMRYRSKKAQKRIRQLLKLHPDRKIRVGLFGGGADPTVWLNDLDLSRIELVIYDVNPKMKGVLEQILGQSLESLGVIYETVNFMEKLKDPKLFDTFDIIIFNGVMSYAFASKPEIIKGTWNLLKVGGMIFFDDILPHPDMLFAKFVRRWTVQLIPEESLNKAIEKNTELLAKFGFTDYQHECQEVRGMPNDLVNYAVKVAA